MTRPCDAEASRDVTARHGVAFDPVVRRGPESMREFRLGPLLILAGMTREPGDRLWGHTEPSGLTRTRHVVSLHYLEVPDGTKVWGAYIGTLCLYWRWGA